MIPRVLHKRITKLFELTVIEFLTQTVLTCDYFLTLQVTTDT